MKASAVLCLASFLAFEGTAAPVLPAQDLDPRKAAREQEVLARRAERLRRQMERLKTRYEKEGRQDHVALLEAGMRYFEQSGLLRKLNAAALALEAGGLRRALQTQAEALADLEHLVQILLDRRSVEDLERRSKEVAARLEELRAIQAKHDQLRRRLAETAERAAPAAERRLRDELERLAAEELRLARSNAAKGSPSLDTLERALGRIEDLKTRAEALGKRFEKPRPETSASPAGALRSLIRDLEDELDRAGARRRLAAAVKALRRLAEEGAGDEELDRAREALRRAARRLDGPAKKRAEDALRAVGDPQAAVGERARRAAKAAESLGEILRAAGREAAARVEGAGERSRKLAARPEVSPRARRQLEGARRALERAATPARAVEKVEADLQEALRRLYAALAGEEARHAPPSEEARALAEAASDLAASLPEAGEAAKEAGKRLEEGGKLLRDAAQAQAGAAADGARRAGARFAEAKRRLETAIEGLRRNQSAKGAAAARTQEGLRRKAEELSAGLKSDQPTDLAPEQAQAAREGLERALAKMREAEEKLRGGSLRSGARRQAEAAGALDEVARSLEEHRRLDAEAKARLADLGRRQEKLAREILELARRLDGERQTEARRALEKAEEAARRAAERMRRADDRGAREAQDEAARKLEEARKKLAQEEDRYWRLRQEELLFRIKDEVKALVERQRQVRRRSLDVAAERGDAARLPRRLRTRLRALGRIEEELADRCRFLAKNLEKEGTIVFTFVFQSLEEDLRLLARLMGKRRPQLDGFVLGLQQEVLERLEMLARSLDEQIQRAREERRNPNRERNTNEGDRRPRLVPDDAELKMLKRLELDTKARIEDFLKLSERFQEALAPDLKRSLERLALRHARISELFQRFLKTRGLAGGSPHGAGRGGKDGAPPEESSAPGGRPPKETDGGSGKEKDR